MDWLITIRLAVFVDVFIAHGKVIEEEVRVALKESDGVLSGTRGRTHHPPESASLLVPPSCLRQSQDSASSNEAETGRTRGRSCAVQAKSVWCPASHV